MTITVKLGTTNNLGVSEVQRCTRQPQFGLIRWVLVFNIEAQPPALLLTGSNGYPTITHYRYRQLLVTSLCINTNINTPHQMPKDSMIKGLKN